MAKITDHITTAQLDMMLPYVRYMGVHDGELVVHWLTSPVRLVRQPKAKRKTKRGRRGRRP